MALLPAIDDDDMAKNSSTGRDVIKREEGDNNYSNNGGRKAIKITPNPFVS